MMAWLRAKSISAPSSFKRNVHLQAVATEMATKGVKERGRTDDETHYFLGAAQAELHGLNIESQYNPFEGMPPPCRRASTVYSARGR